MTTLDDTKIVQVDESGFGEVYVRLITNRNAADPYDVEYSDDTEFTNRKDAIARAKELAKEHNCSWETNF